MELRRRVSSTQHIFVMLWQDSNLLPPVLQASTLTTNPLNSFKAYTPLWLIPVHAYCYRMNKRTYPTYYRVATLLKILITCETSLITFAIMFRLEKQLNIQQYDIG